MAVFFTPGDRKPYLSALGEGATRQVWSSYGCNALGNRDSLVTQHQLYQDLDTDPVHRQLAYRNMFVDALSTKGF